MLRHIFSAAAKNTAARTPSRALSSSSSSSPAPAAAGRGRLEGKVAVITGGTGGLGKATAKEFIQEGAAAVLLADVDAAAGAHAAAELGPRAEFVRCDVTAEDDVAGAVDLAVARHGKLDIMFNNAGVAGLLSETAASRLNLSEFDRVMAVNVRGTLAGVKHAARVMAPTGSGAIVCTASIAGVLAGAGPYPYSISKFAIAGIVKTAAAELCRSGIRVNCISPFVIPTPMVLQQFAAIYAGADESKLLETIAELGELKGGARCEPVDVAKAAVYLSSDDGKYVSGHNLVVDGGFTSFKNLSMPLPH